MRIVIIACLILVLNYPSSAQSDVATPDIPFKMPVDMVKLDLDNIKSKKDHPFFKNISVLDIRPDTTRIGIYLFGAKLQARQFSSADPINSMLEKHLEKNLVNANEGQELMILIRKLWLTTYKRKSDYKDMKNPRPERNDGIRSEILFKADCYLKQGDEWVAWMQMDTICYSPALINEWGGRKLSAVLNDFTDRLMSANRETGTRPAFNLDVILAKYTNEYNKPPYTENKFAKGVYVSFDDFKNNRPSNIQYEIKQEKNFANLYLKDKEGKLYYSQRIWGFCDGEHVYAMLMGNLYSVFRTGNSYYLYGSPFIDQRTSSIPIIVPLAIGIAVSEVEMEKKQAVVKGLTIFSIDMQTGEFY